MVAFLLLVETEDYHVPDHLSRGETVLHLLYESARPNKALHLTARFARRR
jgi:hypothetical protein